MHLLTVRYYDWPWDQVYFAVYQSKKLVRLRLMKTYIDNYWCLQFVKHIFDSAICLSQLIRLTMFYCFFSYNKSERCFMEPFSQYFSRRLPVWVLLWSNAGKRQYQSNLSSWAILEIRLTHVIYCLLHHRFHCNTSLFTRNSLRTICLPAGVFWRGYREIHEGTKLY